MLVETSPPPTAPSPEAAAQADQISLAWGGELARVANEEPPAVAREAGTVRWELRKLSPGYAAHAVSLLALDELPEALRAAVAGYENSPDALTPTALFDRLIAYKPAGEPVVPDATLVNVVQWHGYRTGELQKSFDVELEGHKEIYRQKIADAVKAGRVRPEALDNLERLDRARVILDDGFSTEIRDVHGFMASHIDGSYLLAVEPRAEAYALYHEFSHIVLEGERAVAPNETDFRDPSTRGLYRLFDAYPGSLLLGETVLDLSVVELATGQAIDISAPPPKELVYSRGFPLVKALCTLGKKPIDLQLFKDAQIENSGSGGEIGPMGIQLLEELDTAFPGMYIAWRIAGIGKAEGQSKIPSSKDVQRFVRELRLARVMRGLGIDLARRTLRQLRSKDDDAF